MDTRTRCLELHEVAKQAKTHMWEAHSERDMQPMAAAGFENLSEWVDLCIADAMSAARQSPLALLMMRGEPRFGPLIARIIKGIVTADPKLPERWAAGKGHQVMLVAFTSDSYTMMVDTEGKTDEEILAERRRLSEEIEHGDMSKDFAENPETKVIEALDTMLWERTATGVNHVIVHEPYRLDDGGRLEWLEPHVMEYEDVSTDDDSYGQLCQYILPCFKLEGGSK